MGKTPKIQKHKTQSIIKQAFSEKSSVDLLNDDYFKISFRHLDTRQGQNFNQWQKTMMLAEAMTTLKNYCSASLESQLSKSFTIYGGFPPLDKTGFTFPEHVPEDAKWARIHVNGTHCLIGHVVKNTFYLVFLDQGHKFWISELKHT